MRTFVEATWLDICGDTCSLRRAGESRACIARFVKVQSDWIAQGEAGGRMGSCVRRPLCFLIVQGANGND